MVEHDMQKTDSGLPVSPDAQRLSSGGGGGGGGGGGSPTDSYSARRPILPDRPATFAFLIFWAAWTGVLAHTWTRHPGLDHGDYLSDGNVLHSGKNYDTHGLRENRGLPSYLDVGVETERPRFDTHYPALPYWLLQVWKAAGCKTLASFRAVAVGVTAVASLLAMIVMSLLTRSRLIGALSAFFYMYNCAFAGYADSLHQFAYGQLTLFAVLLAWIGYERGFTAGRRRLSLALAALFFFIDGWITFEHMAFIPIFAAGRWLWLRQPRLLAGCIVIALVPVAVLASRVSHNAMALGGYKQAIDDFRRAADNRGGHNEAGPTWTAVADTWHQRLSGGDFRSDSHHAEFRFPLLRPNVLYPALFLAVVLICTGHLSGMKPSGRGVAMSALLLLSGGAWLFLMKEHATRHRHVIMWLLPGLSLLLGSLAAAGIMQTYVWTKRNAPIRTLGPIAATLLIIGFVYLMHESSAWNTLVRMDRRAHGKIVTRQMQIERARQAGAEFAENTKIRFAGPVPEYAYAIGRPCRFMYDEKDDKLAPNEVLWIPSWDDHTGRIPAATDRYGLPERLTPPASASYVFYGNRRPGNAVDIRYDDTCRITHARLSPTLDGQGLAIVMRVESELEGDERADLIFECKVFDASGKERAKSEARLTDCPNNGVTAVVSHLFSKSDLPSGAAFHIALRSESADTDFEVQADSILPDAAELNSDRTVIAWRSPPGGF